MKCKLKNRDELIAKYLTEELSENEAKVFEEHYFQCETCFKELKAAEDAISLIAREGSSALHASETPKQKSYENSFQKFFGRSTYKRWGIAIASASVIALILIITFQNHDEKTIANNKFSFNETDSLNEKDTSSAMPDKPAFGEAPPSELHQNEENISRDKNAFAALAGPHFKPNSYFEEWINERTRSVNEIIDTVFSPTIGEKFNNEEIIFKWKMNETKSATADKQQVSLKILDNFEKEIFKLTPIVVQSKIITVKIEPKTFDKSGLYYWQIEDKNEVLYVGKFYFLK